MTEDSIRILRLVEYTGPRSAVERQVKQAIQGERIFNYHGGPAIIIRATTLGQFPDIIEVKSDTPTNFSQQQLRALVDDVWGVVTESTEVPQTSWADSIIARWKEKIKE